MPVKKLEEELNYFRHHFADLASSEASKVTSCPVTRKERSALKITFSGRPAIYSSAIEAIFYRELGEKFSKDDDRQTARLASNIVWQNLHGAVPALSEEISRAEILPPLGYIDQIDLLLKLIDGQQNSPFWGLIVGEWNPGYHEHEEFEFSAVKQVKFACACRSSYEFNDMLKAAKRDGLVELTGDENTDQYWAKITRSGYERIQSLDDRQSYRQAFIAMWFDKSMEQVCDQAIIPAIVDAGYEAYRIDRDLSSGDQITNEILAQIRRSRLLVADMNHGDQGARGNVYFEAGFALGLGIPVFFTVNESQKKKVHFDTQQYPHTLWRHEDYEGFRKDLASAIEARLGAGPLKKSS